jgi:hypothetical protein
VTGPEVVAGVGEGAVVGVEGGAEAPGRALPGLAVVRAKPVQKSILVALVRSLVALEGASELLQAPGRLGSTA